MKRREGEGGEGSEREARGVAYELHIANRVHIIIHDNSKNNYNNQREHSRSSHIHRVLV